MAITDLWLETNFGADQGGLSTVGYRLYKSDVSDSVARTETGVLEITAGKGNYGAVVPNVPDDAVGIEWDTGGASPVYATEDLGPYHLRASIAFDVWEEILTGATHNIPTSAGRRLRQVAGFIIDDGTSDNDPASTANTMSLDSGTASAIDDFYNHQQLIIVEGTGEGQVRVISDYDGATAVATITPAWQVTPDDTSKYEIFPGVVHSETQGGGYEGGAVWISPGGSTNTKLYVDGTVDEPVNDSIFDSGDARTLADALNLIRFRFEPASTVTLDQSYANRELTGSRWVCALNGQAIDNALIENAILTGVAVSTSIYKLVRCFIGAVSLPNGNFIECAITGLIEFTSGGTTDVWTFERCDSQVAGAGAPVFDGGAGLAEAALSLNLRNWSGGVQLDRLGVGNASDMVSIEGNGQVIISANCTGGTVAIRGNFDRTDLSDGAVTILDDPRFTRTETADQVAAKVLPATPLEIVDAGNNVVETVASTAPATTEPDAAVVITVKE